MKTRPYQMTARADSTSQTADRILDAALQRYARLPYAEMRLDDVAQDAGVTTQTVIRRFGGKPGLVVTLAQRELGRIAAARREQRGTGAEAVVHDLVVHYERYGSLILKVYGEAAQVPGLAEQAALGRAYHVGWCRAAFSDELRGLDRGLRRRRVAQVVALCDATTWRILREDGGLSPAGTEQALRELLLPLLRPPA